VTTFWRASQEVDEPAPPPGIPWQMQLRSTAPGSPFPDDTWITMIGRTAPLDGGPTFIMCGSLMYATTRGELCLRSTDPLEHPDLDFRYLADESDRARLFDISRLVLQIGEHPAFDALRTELQRPAPPDLASDDALHEWISRNVTTGHHVSCTCRMGPASDSTAVVDQEGRVYGVDNLRVIDASIMPDCPSVNLNGTVMMMAEKLADRLRA
jgi:choline dehydrogenase